MTSLISTLQASNKPYFGGEYCYDSNDFTSPIGQLTGKRPVINGVNLQNMLGVGFIPVTVKREKNLNRDIVLGTRGVIPHYDFHMKHPLTSTYKAVTTSPTANLSSILPGGIYHDSLLAALDSIGDYFLDLKTAGVDAIFRPFHEMNGGWFWWGQGGKTVGNTPQKYKDLYNFTVNAIKAKGCDNITFCWSPNARKSNTQTDYNNLYPGDANVDIIGLDMYNINPMNNLSDLIFLNSFSQAKGKPLAFAEFGSNIRGLKGLAGEEVFFSNMSTFMSNFDFIFVMGWENNFFPFTPGATQDDFVNNFIPNVYLVDGYTDDWVANTEGDTGEGDVGGGDDVVVDGGADKDGNTDGAVVRVRGTVRRRG